ncbi:MAG: hypothetical protein QM831_28295 [Kofleriaceae bacterium]
MKFAFVAILLAACSKAPAEHKQAAAQQPAPTMAEDKIGMPGSQDLAGLSNLPATLQTEKDSRPGAKVTADKVYAALDAKGIKMVSHHQVLASIAGAQYCELGATADTIAVSVCEYATHDAAVAGRKMMNERYSKLVPDAVREVNGSTLVTIANASRHADTRAQMIQTFQQL